MRLVRKNWIRNMESTKLVRFYDGLKNKWKTKGKPGRLARRVLHELDSRGMSTTLIRSGR